MIGTCPKSKKGRYILRRSSRSGVVSERTGRPVGASLGPSPSAARFGVSVPEQASGPSLRRDTRCRSPGGLLEREREREREQCTLIRGKRYPHPPPRLHPLLTCRRLASALADPLSPAPRRGAALLPRVGERFENYTLIWQND